MDREIYWILFFVQAAAILLTLFVHVFIGIPAVTVLVILLIITLSSLLFSNFVIETINRLSDAIFDISHGNFKPFSIKRSGFEFRRIEDAIDEMQHKMQRTIGDLTDAREKMKAIISSMAEGVIAVDKGGKILFVNRSAGNLLGKSEEELIEKSIYERIRIPEIIDPIRQVTENGGNAETEINLFADKGKTIVIHVSETAGHGAVIVMNDTTRIKRLERMRSEFVANVTHELKTPLTSIIASSETLMDGAIDDKAKNIVFLDKIKNNATRLSSLIDDILELSSLEMARVYEEKSVKIRPVIENALETINQRILNNKVNIRSNVPDLSVMCTDDHLLRILLNLLDNAVKYNKNGGSVAITAKRDNEKVIIEVYDTGIGIPKEHLSRIFERFYTVDRARSRELGGTGLGLAIVKHIVELHGGTINVESTPGEGSTFSFKLKSA